MVGEMSDDHFNDLQGKPGGGGRVCRRRLRRGTPWMHLLESDQSSTPNSLDEQFNYCNDGHY